MVVKRTFVIVGVFDPLLPGEQVFREFQHVVRIASLGRRRTEVRGRARRLEEAFTITVAADDPRMTLSHPCPEVLRDRTISGVTGNLVTSRRAGDLGNLRVCMLARQLVPIGTQRFQDRMMMKPL
jgi:hypothetical protein